jgi:hypothetical protein
MERSTWSVVHEPQRCIWASPSERPEIDIYPHATDLRRHGDQEAAVSWLLSFLAGLGAEATWADVRPIEECAKCKADFPTAERHSCVTLLHEWLTPDGEPDTDQGPLGCEYVARFCPTCSEELQEEIL